MANVALRNLHRTGIERVARYIATNDFEAAAIEKIEVRMKRIEELWQKFSEEHEHIVAITVATDAEAVGINDEMMVRTEENYLAVVSNLKRRMNEIGEQKVRTAMAAAVNPSAVGSTAANNVQHPPRTQRL